MVSQTEVALVKANGNSATARRRSKRASSTTKKASKARSNRQAPKAPTGTDIVPVMKLKAIDIVDGNDAKNAKKRSRTKRREIETPPIVHMPPPQADANGMAQSEQHEVTDPELLELLQQLSETIDTANTVLEVAASEVEPTAASSYTNGAANDGGEMKPVPEPEQPDEDDGDEMPLAAQAAALHAKMNQNPEPKKSGLGLVAKAALAGLVLAAGAAWILHTNPWILNDLRSGAAQTSDETSRLSSAPLTDKTAAAETTQSITTPQPDRTPAAAQTRPAAQQSGDRIETASATSPTADPAPAPAEKARPAQPSTVNSVAEPVLTSPGQSVALDIAVAPDPGSLETSVMVQGVPADAKLSAGKDLGSGNWLLNAEELIGLRLETGMATPQGMHGMEFMVVRNDGSVPLAQTLDVIVGEPEPGLQNPTQQQASAAAGLPVRQQTTVARQTPAVANLESLAKPAPAKKDVAATPAPLSSAETKALLARSTALLESGDVSGARLLLEYAAQRGSKDAMIMLAQSYDPEHLSKLSVLGVQPNKELAARWYDRAANAGQ